GLRRDLPGLVGERRALLGRPVRGAYQALGALRSDESAGAGAAAGRRRRNGGLVPAASTACNRNHAREESPCDDRPGRLEDPMLGTFHAITPIGCGVAHLEHQGPFLGATAAMRRWAE